MHFRLEPKLMTLDDLELLLVQIFTEFCDSSHFWEATTAKRMKIDSYYQWQKCSPMTHFRIYKVYEDICGGSPALGRQMTVGLSLTVIFGDLGGYFFGNIRDKAGNIMRRYATLCWPEIDCKITQMNDLE